MKHKYALQVIVTGGPQCTSLYHSAGKMEILMGNLESHS
jgi:hypothetical protein